MGDRPIPTARGVVPGQVAEIIVTLDGEPGRRGSGYRVGPTSVLTAAHVIERAVSVRVRFDADLPGEWTAEVISHWADPRSDLAVLTIAREGEPTVAVTRFGQIGGDRAAVLAARAVGFPRFKLKTDDDAAQLQYRDSHQADGSVAVLSNRREGTLELTVPPPDRDPDPKVSPWEGMSGAAVWIDDRIVGVIAKHHRSDGLGRLAAARLDLALAGLDQGRRAELRTLLDLPDVLPDVAPPSTGEWVRTAYQAQVRDIAPDQLLDREAELDELVGFCAGDQPYSWWQAGPWVGKSALMSWFVLHPPVGVDVVSFFVTARLAGQSDSDACTTALIEQFAAFLGESPATLLTAGARRGTLLRLLEDAANRSREAGRRLLLVIDGLDEDSGTGLSIAALLPRRPPPEVRVLVASRPHPPIPDDVDDDHPLRTISPRQLQVSQHARDVERRAKHELKQLLVGEQLQRDVLGLITAAGGGLTLADLEQLTERPPFEIEYLLGGVFGRTVGSRTRSPAVERGEERVYLFTHETLRLMAEQQYGKSLAAYRDRLHAWADDWRRRGWPRDTPQYLLRSYPRMLGGFRDIARLVVCATDQARHDRMRDLTGGDALAFTEISTVQQLVFAQPDPDLTSLARIAVQREHLIDRSSHIPIDLPAAWAVLGQPARAEALANSIPSPLRRVEALVGLVKVAAVGGDCDRVARLASEVEALIGQIADQRQQGQALVRRAVPAAGNDHDRGRSVVIEVKVIADQFTNSAWHAERLVQLMNIVAVGGDCDRVARLASEVEALIRQIADQRYRRQVLAGLTESVAPDGDHDRAEGLIRQITDLSRRGGALARLAVVVAADGDYGRAARLAGEAEDHTTGQIIVLNRRTTALARLAVAVAAGGDHDRAVRLATDVEALTGYITDPGWRAAELARLVEVVAAIGDHDWVARLTSEAETIIGQIAEPYLRAGPLARIAEVVAAVGDHDWAEELIGQITEHEECAEALAQRAVAVAADGDHDRAEALIGPLISPGWRAPVLARLAEVAAAGGDGDRAARLSAEAEMLAWQITEPDQQARALVRLALAFVADSDHDRVVHLTDEAEALAGQITDPDQLGAVLAQLAVVVAAFGDQDRAEMLTGQIPDPGLRGKALAQLAVVAAASDDHGRATHLADEAEALTGWITQPDWRTAQLAELGRVLAETSKETHPIVEHARRSSPLTVRARRLLAAALMAGSWTQVVSGLAHVDPLAVTALADEVQARWGLDSSGGRRKDGEH